MKPAKILHPDDYIVLRRMTGLSLSVLPETLKARPVIMKTPLPYIIIYALKGFTVPSPWRET